MPSRTRASAMRSSRADVPRRQAKRRPRVVSRLVVCRMPLWTPTPVTTATVPLRLPEIARQISDPLTLAALGPPTQAKGVASVIPWWREAVAAAIRPAAAKTTLAQNAPARPDQAVLPTEGESALSAREWEVFALLAAGLTNNAIANDLLIATSTVKWYVKQIYAKLGVHSRTQAVARLSNRSALFQGISRNLRHKSDAGRFPEAMEK